MTHLMVYKIVVMVLLLGAAGPVYALDCPKSSPELMRHLGRALLKADTLALNRHPETVSPEDFLIAIAGIESAVQCTQPTLTDCESSLLPERLRGEKAGPYQLLMKEFIALLASYKAEFTAQSELRPEERDFGVLRTLKQEIKNVVRRSHAEL